MATYVQTVTVMSVNLHSTPYNPEGTAMLTVRDDSFESLTAQQMSSISVPYAVGEALNNLATPPTVTVTIEY